tara:strand:- start:4736 stop:6049 length:1314 start_codon:yes stop_codon:yes gene_type:complete
MTNTVDITQFNSEGFESFLSARPQPSWLEQRRRTAWSTFEEMDWPTRRQEEWIRTDIRLFKLDKFGLPAAVDAPSQTVDSLLGDGLELGGQVTNVDGICTSSRICEELSAKGVIFGSLDELAGEHSELIESHLMNSGFDAATDRFSALHAACFTGGVFLHVPRGVNVDLPLHTVSQLSDGAVDLGHTLVILEDGANATLLAESHSTSEDASGLHCGGIELVVGNDAHLRYVNLQDWGQGVWHFGHQHADVGRNGSLQWTSAALGSRLAKINQHVSLSGEYADCQVNGVLFTEGKQHLSYHTMQHHVAPNCHSDFLYKSALQDKSRTVWRGMIKVDPDAQKTDGYQRNDNLLLSDNCRADSIPGLEIEADDVRCTHGSTSGKVDEELIFYAQCRGYTRNEAIRLIVTGFFQQIFDRITIDSVRDALGLAIARRVREYE